MMFSWAAQTGKHLLRTQNVSEQNQKQFLCPGHKILSVANVARAGKRGSICVGNNVSATTCPPLPGLLSGHPERNKYEIERHNYEICGAGGGGLSEQPYIFEEFKVPISSKFLFSYLILYLTQ